MLQLTARAEQEVRARPGLHAAFYAVVRRSPAVRHLIGRLKSRVRGTGHRTPPAPEAVEDEPVRRRRDEAVAVRLGLRPGGGR